MRGSRHSDQHQASQRRLLSIPTPWYDVGAAGESAPVDASALPTAAEVEALREQCEAMYKEQLAAFADHRRKNKRSDAFFADAVMKDGTLSDKLASTAIQIRDYPFFSLRELRFLVASSQKKGRREAQLAAQHLVDLLVSGSVVPKTRALVSLARRPVGAGQEKTGAKRLLIWYFEDQLKLLVAAFVQALHVGARDEMTYHKDSCLKMAFRLLCEMPEREKENLEIVIGKAGDKVKRVASRVPYLLGMLVQQHSNMRQAVVAEVERFLYKPSTPESARYYLVIFLTQVGLNRGDSALAKNLIQIYFAFLHKLVEKKLDDDDEDDDGAKKKAAAKKQKKKRKVRMQQDGTSTKLQHLKAKAGKLNSKMLTALLTGVSRAFPYLEKGDDGMFDAQMDTFFKVIYTASFNKSCHALSLLLKIMIARGSVSDRFYQALYYMLLLPDLRGSSKQALFLNVLYGAMRHDTSIARVRAFVKRVLQVALHERSNFVCAALVVVSETMRVHEEVRDMVTVAEMPEEDAAEKEAAIAKTALQSEFADERAHQLKKLRELEQADDAEAGEAAKVSTSTRRVYNPLKENPLRANADNSCAWELLLLSEHNHPSVALFAKQILDLSLIKYDGDPLLDFSLSSFLDRFAYKAPKKNPKRMPADHEMKFDKQRLSFAATAPSVDSHEFLQQREENVRPEEQFMFEHMRARVAKKKQGDAVAGDGGEEEGDEEDELLMEEDDDEGDLLDDDEMGDIDFDDDDEDEGDDLLDADEGGDSGGEDDYLWADDGLVSAFERDEEAGEKEEEEERHEKKREAKRKTGKRGR
jgi:ribosome biogenesis protein MAK21